jgi:hypothetical protein
MALAADRQLTADPGGSRSAAAPARIQVHERELIFPVRWRKLLLR